MFAILIVNSWIKDPNAKCIPMLGGLGSVQHSAAQMATMSAGMAGGGGDQPPNWNWKAYEASDDVGDEEEEEGPDLRICNSCKNKTYLRKGLCASRACALTLFVCEHGAQEEVHLNNMMLIFCLLI